MIPLNSQGKIKTNINENFTKFWSRAELHTLYFKSHSLWSLQIKPWESWPKPAEGENWYQSQLSWTSAVSSWEGKVDIGCVFLSKFRLLWIWFLGAHGVWMVSLPGTASAFLFVLFENLAHAGCWLLHMQTAHPLGWRLQKWLDRNARHTSFVVRICWLLPGLKFVFLLAVFGSDSGLWEDKIFGGC